MNWKKDTLEKDMPIVLEWDDTEMIEKTVNEYVESLKDKFPVECNNFDYNAWHHHTTDRWLRTYSEYDELYFVSNEGAFDTMFSKFYLRPRESSFVLLVEIRFYGFNYNLNPYEISLHKNNALMIVELDVVTGRLNTLMPPTNLDEFIWSCSKMSPHLQVKLYERKIIDPLVDRLCEVCEDGPYSTEPLNGFEDTPPGPNGMWFEGDCAVFNRDWRHDGKCEYDIRKHPLIAEKLEKYMI